MKEGCTTALSVCVSVTLVSILFRLQDFFQQQSCASEIHPPFFFFLFIQKISKIDVWDIEPFGCLQQQQTESKASIILDCGLAIGPFVAVVLPAICRNVIPCPNHSTGCCCRCPLLAVPINRVSIIRNLVCALRILPTPWGFFDCAYYTFLHHPTVVVSTALSPTIPPLL